MPFGQATARVETLVTAASSDALESTLGQTLVRSSNAPRERDPHGSNSSRWGTDAMASYRVNLLVARHFCPYPIVQKSEDPCITPIKPGAGSEKARHPAQAGIHPSRERGRPARKRTGGPLPDIAMRAGRPRSRDAPSPMPQAASGCGRARWPRGRLPPLRSLCAAIRHAKTSTRGEAPGPHERQGGKDSGRERPGNTRPVAAAPDAVHRPKGTAQLGNAGVPPAFVVPAKAGIHFNQSRKSLDSRFLPASAGMTG